MSQKKLGNDRAKKYHQRLGEMLDIESFNDIQFLPGNYHSLKGNRNGQWSCDLDQPYRLIFKPVFGPILYNKNRNTILTEMRIVEIIEIVDYH